MILADLDRSDHAPPTDHAPAARPRLTIVPPPTPRTLTAAEALALLVAPRPIAAALHVLLHPRLLSAWWGVVYFTAALFCRLDDGRGTPVAGRAELNAGLLVDLVSTDAPELVTELDAAELAHRTDPTHPAARPWVVLEGVALGRLLVQREPLHRLATAAASLGTPDGRPARAWTERADLSTLGRAAAGCSDVRTLVVDGGDWIALLTEVLDGPAALDQAMVVRLDRATLTTRETDAHDQRPVTLPAGWP